MADVSHLNYLLLRKKLQDFHTRLIPLLDDCSIRMQGNFDLRKCDDSDRFELGNCIVISGVPLRPNSNRSSKRLTIFLHLRGHVCAENNVQSFNTRTAYSLTPQNSEPKEIDLVRGMHYDYERTTKILHPVCHVQEDILTLQSEIEQAQYGIGNFPYISHHKQNYLSNTNSVRIPTPFMDFFSVILMILADHCISKDSSLQLNKFNELCTFVIDHQAQVEVVHDNLHELSQLRNGAVSDLHSSHWYITQQN